MGHMGFQCNGAGGGVADPERLGSLGQIVQDLVTEGGVQTQQAQLCSQFLWVNCVEC